jgi:hypothetical protein
MNVEIGKTYRHKHLKNYTCVVLSDTNKGWKVKEIVTPENSRKKVKETIQYYSIIDFNDEKGLWEEIKS